MNKTMQNAISWFLLLAGIIGLLPITLNFLLLCVFIVPALFLQVSDQTLTNYLHRLLIVVSSSYGLISLWWLIFNFRKMMFSQIPKRAGMGLVVGVLVAVSGLNNSSHTALFMSPLIVLFCLILFMLYRDKSKP